MENEDTDWMKWREYFNISTSAPFNTSFLEGDEFKTGDIEVLTQYLGITRTMRNIYLPFVVLVGLIGNTLTSAVFASNHIRQPAPTAFLAMLALVDNAFLVALFATWFDIEITNILVSDGICQILFYITYVTAFLSVWYVVGFTFERYVNLVYPLRAPLFCSQFREKLAVFVLAVFALGVYTFAFWTTQVNDLGGTYRCGYSGQYFDLQKNIVWFDMIITMPVPFLLILCLNVRVVCAVSLGSRQRSKENTTRSVRKRSQVKVTRTLLLVSSTFLILNLPSHSFRFYILIMQYTSPTRNIQPIHLLIQEITQLLYYTTFSVNFFLYTLYGKQFKLALCLMLKRWKVKLCKRRKNQNNRRFSRGSLMNFTETTMDNA